MVALAPVSLRRERTFWALEASMMIARNSEGTIERGQKESRKRDAKSVDLCFKPAFFASCAQLLARSTISSVTAFPSAADQN